MAATSAEDTRGQFVGQKTRRISSSMRLAMMVVDAEPGVTQLDVRRALDWSENWTHRTLAKLSEFGIATHSNTFPRSWFLTSLGVESLAALYESIGFQIRGE